MNTLTHTITEALERGKIILADNPKLVSISFALNDYPVKDVEQAALELDRKAEFMFGTSTVAFMASAEYNNAFVYVHVRSVEVKAKVVYE